MHGKSWIKPLIIGGMAALITAIIYWNQPTGKAYAQQPTGSIPTVTSTPTGPYVTVYSDQSLIGVFAGPSSYNYDQIGILAAGERATAIGYSQDGNWIEIVYMGVPGGKGWVYGPFVAISTSFLPKLEAPPTAAPRTTPTLNPTFVTAFGVQLAPTHLPTFTAPAPLKLPSYAPATSNASKVPYGLVIVVLALVGILGAIISFLRGNR
jgi:hypothetical protein